MGWPEAMTQGRPPPYEGEPADLRGDIVDELADHLALAMKRELRRNEDETVARRAVLDRFGDPLAIARRLWWDAMKEKIMKDRLMLVGLVVVLAGVLVVLGLSWAAQSRINQALLAKLETLTTQPAARAVPENWAKLNVRVVEGTAGGPPVAGVSVSFRGKAFTDSDITLDSRTDTAGRAAFGPVRPGKYVLSGFLAESGRASCYYEIALYPGEASEQVIVCPSAAAGGTAAFRWQGLPDWLDPGTIIECNFWKNEQLALEGANWSIPPQTVRFNLAGQILEGKFDARPGAGNQVRPGEYHHLSLPEAPRLGSSVKWIEGRYHLGSVRVYQPVPASEVFRPGELSWKSQELPYRQYNPQPDGARTFDLVGGQANTWTLELPADLLKQVYQTTPVTVTYRIDGVPEWLEPDALLECEMIAERDTEAPLGPNDARPAPTPVKLRLNGEITRDLKTHRFGPAGPGRWEIVDRMWPGPLPTRPTTEMLPQKYRLVSLRLCRPVPNRDPENAKALYWRPAEPKYQFPAAQRPVFEPVVGKPNVWTIALPAGWLDEVRAAGIPTSQPVDSVMTGPGSGGPMGPMGPGRPATRPLMGPAGPTTRPAGDRG